MSRRTIYLGLMVLGLVLMGVSLGADWIGIGSYPGIHWAQLTGAGVGLIGLIAGYWLVRTKNIKKE